MNLLFNDVKQNVAALNCTLAKYGQEAADMRKQMMIVSNDCKEMKKLIMATCQESKDMRDCAQTAVTQAVQKMAEVQNRDRQAIVDQILQAQVKQKADQPSSSSKDRYRTRSRSTTSSGSASYEGPRRQDNNGKSGHDWNDPSPRRR